MFSEIKKACQNTYQFKSMSILDHGLLVNSYFLDLYNHLFNGSPLTFSWKLPDNLLSNKELILSNLLPLDIINEYQIWHDCSKPFCRIIDHEGKQHFPNHAKLSESIWQSIGSELASKLMGMDMLPHTLKSLPEINTFILKPQSITLILTAFCEVHANAELFGGINSTGFKIKFKQVNKIFNRWLFYHLNYRSLEFSNNKE